LIKSWVLAQHPRAEIEQLWYQASMRILVTIKNEEDVAMVAQLFTTYIDCLELVEGVNIDPQMMTAFTHASLKQFELYFGRMQARIGKFLFLFTWKSS
jgi:hypothetical protein